MTHGDASLLWAKFLLTKTIEDRDRCLAAYLSLYLRDELATGTWYYLEAYIKNPKHMKEQGFRL